jgi:hypothetical protein
VTTLPAKPWNIIEHSESFEVKADSGQVIAYVYFEDEPKRQWIGNRLSKEQARTVAEKIAGII